MGPSLQNSSNPMDSAAEGLPLIYCVANNQTSRQKGGRASLWRPKGQAVFSPSGFVVQNGRSVLKCLALPILSPHIPESTKDGQ